MPEHRHNGDAHPIGSRPAECAAQGMTGPVISCDRGGWFDPARPLFCRHAEAQWWTPYLGPGGGGGAGGSPLWYGGGGGAGGGKVPATGGGTPYAWVPVSSPWTDAVRVPGVPPGTVRFRRRPGYQVDRNDPLQVVEIPCNPDEIGEQTVKLKVTRPSVATAPVGTDLAGVMKSEIAVEIPKDHDIEVDQVFRGEHCRSVRYEIYVQSVAFDVEVVVPGAAPVTFVVSEPVGWIPVKSYIEPTCCTTTTQRLQRTIEKSAAGARGETRLALKRAADQLLLARGLLPVPARTAGALDAYARAARHLADAARGEVAKPLAEIVRIARRLAEPVVADALASRFAPSDPLAHALLVRGGADAAADLAAAESARRESPADAVVWYAAAWHCASAAIDAAALARVDVGEASRKKRRT